MLTADTHFVDGYLDDSCQLNFDNKYANVFSCSDNMVFQFIEWIKDLFYFYIMLEKHKKNYIIIALI